MGYYLGIGIGSSGPGNKIDGKVIPATILLQAHNRLLGNKADISNIGEE